MCHHNNRPALVPLLVTHALQPFPHLPSSFPGLLLTLGMFPQKPPILRHFFWHCKSREPLGDLTAFQSWKGLIFLPAPLDLVQIHPNLGINLQFPLQGLGGEQGPIHSTAVNYLRITFADIFDIFVSFDVRG